MKPKTRVSKTLLLAELEAGNSSCFTGRSQLSAPLSVSEPADVCGLLPAAVFT